MRWGYKSRFSDLKEVLKFSPSMVEFHMTQEDVETGGLNGQIYPCDVSLHLPEYWNQTLIDPCDTSKYSEHIAIYKQCIEKGILIGHNFEHTGSMKVVLHPGGMSVETKTAFERNALLSYLWTFYHKLKKDCGSAVEILIENMPPLPWFYGGQYYSNVFVDPDEIVEFCNQERCNVCLDISHLGLFCNYTGRDLITEIKKLLPYTRQIHLADADGTDGEGAPIGEGNVDFKAVIETIKGLDVAVIPEVMFGHHRGYKAFTDIIKECSQWL